MDIKYFIKRIHRLRGKRLGQIFNTGKNLVENKFRSIKVYTEPMTVQIEPSNRCNLYCKQCFRYAHLSKRETGDMEFAVFERIIQQFKYVFDVSLIGLGESFLNNDLFKMIDLLSDRHIDVSLTTNGTVYNEKIINSINKARRIYIQFSLDSACRETYNKIRGVDSFDKVISNIKRFMKLRNPSVDVSLGLVVMQDNLKELSNFVRLSAELNIKRIHFGDLNGPWLGDNKDELIINRQNGFKENIANAFQIANKIGVEIKYNRYSYIWGDNANLTNCWFLWQFPYITWDGYVTPCCNLPNPETFNFGNVLKIPFKEIWNSYRYQAFRKSLVSQSPHKLCGTCHLSE